MTDENDYPMIRCPSCGFTGDLDAFDVLGAHHGCLFCNQCHDEFRMDGNEVQGDAPRQATLFD